jgi:hypothetical protein
MGFHLRKSIRVGPMRFNLSSSGVGVSAGVRGFRVGTGPRGNYVHMSKSGIWYRATLPPARGRRQEAPAEHAPLGQPAYGAEPSILPATHEALQEIESSAASTIVDSSSADLLREINEKRRTARLLPIVVIVALLASFAAVFSPWRLWLLPLLVVVGALGTWLAHRRDVLAKTVVLFYGMDQEMEKVYAVLHEWASTMASCSRAWHIEAQGRVHDRKYHAGASSIVRRSTTFIRRAEPPYLKTNIETVAIGVGRQVLHFFPDRVLVFDANGVGAVGYSQLQVTVDQTRFIEDGAVPPDAQVVDHTWKYVNKKGGPDRRFKDNRQLPVCLYDELSLRSGTGLNEVIQVSRSSVADGFARAIGLLAAKMPPELNAPTV